MKIVLTGGGSGGHFYPLMAIAEEIRHLCIEKKLIDPAIIYIAPSIFDSSPLQELNIQFLSIPAGKVRKYASVLNILDLFTTFFGTLAALFRMFSIFPDIVISSGGYAAVPTLLASRLLGIPVIAYDADARPGRATLLAARFAERIAVAHPEAAAQFPKNVQYKIAQTGHPIRRDIAQVSPEGGHEFLKLDPTIPTILVMGGSLGAQTINNSIIDALPLLIARYNIIHQTGAMHHAEVQALSQNILRNTPYENRYRSFGLLNALALRMSAGIATVVIARAGSGTIFELATWGIPSILVPIPEDVSHDQTRNAFSYARTGAAEVIEQKNLTQHLLVAELERLIGDPVLLQKMHLAARTFSHPDAARIIAQSALDILVSHA
jgi:UDP-N-acetylglucosamine--N-acetylmuramyl-(pentapeptide) pyrophosphoryl-undecaprenol N-acetylglucosamine transferase